MGKHRAESDNFERAETGQYDREEEERRKQEEAEQKMEEKRLNRGRKLEVELSHKEAKCLEGILTKEEEVITATQPDNPEFFDLKAKIEEGLE